MNRSKVLSWQGYFPHLNNAQRHCIGIRGKTTSTNARRGIPASIRAGRSSTTKSSTTRNMTGAIIVAAIGRIGAIIRDMTFA